MGLIEQIQSGALFTRKTSTISGASVSGSNSEFGSSYLLLGVSATSPCRVRLYSDSSSIAIDASRPTSSFDLNDAVGLVLDAVLNDTLTITFDPPIIGTTFSSGQTWYNKSGSAAVTLTYYPIEQINGGRQEIKIQEYVAANSSVGNEGTVTAPKSFLILSASATTQSRVRLYSVDSSIPLAEIIRSTGSLPEDNSKLIVDMLFDSASYAYKLSPTLEAYNLNNHPIGNNTFKYIIQNRTATTQAVTASIYIYPLET